jgi:extradiol dioxygenase family protein
MVTAAFADVIESHAHLIDLVKFGWETALVTKDMDHIEVSNGTIPLDQEGKADYVRQLAGVRPVLSEVGYKDADRSALLTPADWVGALQQDLAAGASMVITEARESGRSGIARADGHMRGDVLGAVLGAVDPNLVMFEAPARTRRWSSSARSAPRSIWATLDFFGDQLVCHLSDDIPEEPVVYPRHFGVSFAKAEDSDRLLRLVEHRKLRVLAGPALRFEGTAEQHRTIALADASNNVIEFKNYDDPRLQY